MNATWIQVFKIAGGIGSGLGALSFLATSFMVIPQVRLERNLEFHKIAIVDSVQAIVFNGLAVLLAWKGIGASAFAWVIPRRRCRTEPIASGC